MDQILDRCRAIRVKAPVLANTPVGCQAKPRRYIALICLCRRGGRVAEGARLESVYTGNRIVGSNPTPSASPSSALVRSRSPSIA